MRAYLVLVAALLMSTSAPACGGTDVSEVAPPTANLKSFRSVNVEIHVHDPRAQMADVMKLHAEVIGAFRDAKSFTSVAGPDDRTRTELTLRMTVLSFERGEGSLLNEGHVDLELGIELLDNLRGQRIGVFEVEASSRKGFNTGQGLQLPEIEDRTGKALRRAAKAIASYIDDAE